MAQVVIDGKSYEAREGERLAEALRRFGFAVPLPCGGRGACGKCRVTVDGRAELACQYEIHSEMTKRSCGSSPGPTPSGPTGRT